MLNPKSFTTLALFICLVFSTLGIGGNLEKDQVGKTLDKFHDAAAKADGATYFSLFAPEGVFLGTDATERWSVDEFKKYAEPHFSKGKGWKYLSLKRSIDFSPKKDLAWFDEILKNENYGICRGSGILRKIGNDWKIAQYHLTIPVPNSLAKVVVKMITEEENRK